MSDDLSPADRRPNEEPHQQISPPTGEPQANAARSPLGDAGDSADLHTSAEEDLWTGRTHWKHFSVKLLLWTLSAIVVAVLIGWLAARYDWLSGGWAALLILAYVLVTGLIVVGKVFFTIIGHRYRLTTQRLFVERGILSQTVDQTELVRVDDVRVHKSFIDRLCGLGSVEILSTDASDRGLMIDGVANPEQLAESIRQHMRVMRKKSLFIESL